MPVIVIVFLALVAGALGLIGIMIAFPISAIIIGPFLVYVIGGTVREYYGWGISVEPYDPPYYVPRADAGLRKI
jgi:hypothetical protein